MSFLSFFAKLFNSNSKHCKCKSCNRQKTAVGLSVLAAGFCYCQNCDLQVYGQILDLHENSPLSFAVIEVIDSDYKDFSDSDGFFLLRNLCSGKIKIKISHPSCNDFFEELNIDNSISKKFYLEHHVESLEEVILDQSRLKQLSTTAKTYSLSDLQKDQYSGRGLAKALEQISGVNILNTGNVISKPMIHGMFGSRVGIIYDGVQIENQQWGQDHAPNIDQNAFEEIRLIKGAGVLKYSGDTAGGVIVLESELPKINDSLYGKSIVSGMSNGRGLNLTSSWTKSYNSGNYFKVQGMMKRMGDLSTPNYILSNTGTDENNISFSFGRNKILNRWKTNFSFFSQKIGILRSSHIGNLGDLVYAIELASPTIIMPFSHDINPPYQSNKHYTAGIEYTRSNLNKGKFNFKYSWQRNNRKEYDVRRASFKEIPALDLTLDTHDFISSYHWKRSDWSFDGGIFLKIQDNYSNPNTGIRRVIPDYIRTEFGNYFTSSFNPSNDFVLGFGFRYTNQYNHVKKYYENTRWEEENFQDRLGDFVIDEILSQKLVEQKLIFNNISINVGVKFPVLEHMKFNLNLFHTERAPDIAELFSDGLHHSLATIEYGNPFLKSEKTQKLVINLEKRIGDLKFNISPYFTNGQNYMVIEPSGFEYTIRGAFPVWEYRSLSSTIRGVDIDFNYELNDYLKFSSNSSWIEGFEKNNKTPLINIPPFSTNNYLQISIPKWKSFLFTISSKNIFSQNRYPNHNFETSVVEYGERVDKIVDISTPPDAYNLLGMEFHWGPYSFLSDKVSISLIFDNILDKNYRNYLNRLRFYADEMGRNVMLQIKINH